VVKRRGVQVHGEGELRLVGLRAVRNGGEQDHAGAAAMGFGTYLFAHRVALQRIHAVGQMEVMRLGRAKRQHGHFIVLLLDGVVIRFGQFSRGASGEGGVQGISDCRLGIAGFRAASFVVAPFADPLS